MISNTHLRAVAATRLDEMQEIVDEAGPTRDLGRVRRYGGDVKVALRDLQFRNAELEELADEFDRRGMRLYEAPPAAVAAERRDYHQLRVVPLRFAPLKGGL
jgi:hypothetical protein